MYAILARAIYACHGCSSSMGITKFTINHLHRLDYNSIAEKGAGMLADALRVNQSLQTLRLVVESSVYACRADSAEYWSYWHIISFIVWMLTV